MRKLLKGLKTHKVRFGTFRRVRVYYKGMLLGYYTLAAAIKLIRRPIYTGTFPGLHHHCYRVGGY